MRSEISLKKNAGDKISIAFRVENAFNLKELIGLLRYKVIFSNFTDSLLGKRAPKVVDNRSPRGE